MDRPWLTCCYFPTTVVLVDDNPQYLNNLLLELDVKQAAYKTISDSDTALKFLSEHYGGIPFTQKYILQLEEEEVDCCNISVNIRAIAQEYYNQKRFNQISIIIVDYTMPGLTGLELCTLLKNKPFKKILLTGEAGESLAVQAFNQGIIDRFFRKDADNLNEVLNEAIKQLQKQYFINACEFIVKTLINKPEFPLTYLQDIEFIKFFNNLIASKKITEYYLVNSQGNFLLVDYKNDLYSLTVKTSAEMDYLYELAKTEQAPITVVDALKTKQKMLCFNNQELQALPKDWDKYLYPAQKIIGQEIYYHSIGNIKNIQDFLL